MPIASLQRFSVPIPGTASQGLLMPKLKYRFRVNLIGFGIGLDSTELTKQVMNVSRPEITHEEIKLHVYNSTVKIAGKHSIGEPKLTLRDDASGSVSKIVGQQMQKQFDFYEQASASTALDYKFRMQVEILDGGNGGFEAVVLESFEFVGCYIKGVTYQGGDYSSNEALDIALTLSADNVIQQITSAGPRSGIGEVSGRIIRPSNDQGLATGVGGGLGFEGL